MDCLSYARDFCDILRVLDKLFVSVVRICLLLVDCISVSYLEQVSISLASCFIDFLIRLNLLLFGLSMGGHVGDR